MRVLARVCAQAGWVLILAAGLAGCAALRPAPPPEARATDAWAARSELLRELDHWTLDGRVAVQRGAEGGTAQLRWQQRGETFDLRIMAPLGRGTYRLEGDARRVSLTAPNGQRYESDRLETLMAQHLDWTLPVAGARYWVRGVPAPTPPASDLRFDEAGRLSDCAQAGWRISVLEYDEATEPDLPRRLFLAADDFKLRIAITGWTLDTAW